MPRIFPACSAEAVLAHMYIHITQHVIPQKCTLSTSAMSENALFPVYFPVKFRSVISIILLIPFKRIVIYHYLPFAAACVQAFVRYTIKFLIIIRVCVNHMYSFIYNHAIIPFIGSAARSRTCYRPFGE